MVKAYQMLMDFKCSTTKIDQSQTSGLAFAQKAQQPKKATTKNTDKEEPKCYGCGKVGVLVRSCPDCKANREKNKPADTKAAEAKEQTLVQDVKKKVQIQETEVSDYGLFQGHFMFKCMEKHQEKMNLRDCILLDNESTVHAF